MKKIISNLRSQISNSSGFTLVELLVVIGVLGILASGLLATVDPLEQFRKASDSNKSQTSLELVNAIQRYYAVHGAFPWDAADEGGDTNCTASKGTITGATGMQATAADGTANGFTTNCIGILALEGELKTTFAQQLSILRYLFIKDYTAAGSTDKKFRVCYDPESKSVSRNVNTKFSSADLTGATVCNPITTNTCMACVE